MSRASIDQPAIEQAVAALRRGEVIGFPTETVYGLGADASNEAAVRRIFATKGRPADHPVIVHLADVALLHGWADQIPNAAYALADHFWPGPLTMILLRGPHVLDAVTGGQASVGLRVPDHPVARALLRTFAHEGRGGIAAPSANRFGRVSPTRAEHVRAEFGHRVPIVLDGGPSQVGLESTIVDLTGDQPLLLRPGQITASQLSAVLGTPIGAPDQTTTRAPGTLASHYAPATPVHLVPADQIASFVLDQIRSGRRIAVLSRHAPIDSMDQIVWREAASDPMTYAHDLYANLRDLDAHGCDLIVVEAVPSDEPWRAVADRLRRAAHPA